MIFKVKNLGYIEEAEVDLSKDLIVFTGHNNTGKTYLAYAVYSFFSMDYKTVNRIFSNSEILDNFIDWSELGGFIDNIFNTGFAKMPLSYISNSLFKYMKSEGAEKLFSKYLENNLSLLFSNKDENFFKKSIVDFSLNTSKQVFDTKLFRNEIKIKYDLYTSYENYEKKNWFDFYIEKDKDSDMLRFIIEYIPGINDFSSVVSQNKNEMLRQIKRVFNDFYKMTLLNLIWQSKNVYIAPAERNAINIFSKELSLGKGKAFNGRDNNVQFLNRYPQPIQDNLEIAEDLAHLSRNKSSFAYLAEELEQDFLKGTISTNQYGQIEYTPDNMDKMNLEIHLTASMVKSLSNIVFYLRHLAQKGDCIIIDEPELNLHPDNQRKIARFIGRLVNEGFQVVISTHSDYIIKELNNMIMLSKAKGERDDLIKNLGFRGDELLKPEQVEAQLFTLNSRKPEKIPITDEGFEVSTINEVIEKQDNDLEKIYYELFQKVV